MMTVKKGHNKNEMRRLQRICYRHIDGFIEFLFKYRFKNKYKNRSNTQK